MSSHEPADAVKTEAPDAGASASATSASPERPQRKRRLDVNPSLILSSEGRSKRRRTPSPAPDSKPDLDPKNPERAKALGMQIYHKVMAMHDSSGESMAEPFVKLPNKRQFPDYYETIKHPLSLDMVHQKLDGGKYETLREVCADFQTIWNNAKRYNMKESTLFQWAKQMHKLTRTFYNTHTSGKDESDSEDEGPAHAMATPAPMRSGRAATSVSAAASPSPGGPSTPAGGDTSVLPKPSGPGTGKKRGSYMKDGPTVYKLIKPCMRDIKSARANDGSDREIATLFLQLPDRKTFPDYYRTVKNPVSLEDIEHRMVSRRYHTSDDFFEEVERLCDNAMQYNEDESEVWRDAQQIRGIVAHHREAVRERLSQPSKGSGRPHSKTGTPVSHGPHSATHTPNLVGGVPTMPPGMHLPPELRGAYGAHAGHFASPQMPGYPQQHQHQQRASPAQGQHPPGVGGAQTYLPQLPQGVVTEEVVASLERYPHYEQQAWVASLPPLALNIYRQMAAANDARKRGVAPPTPSEQRPATQPPPEPAPAVPTVATIDFAYSTSATGSAASTPSEDKSKEGLKSRPPLEAIRLRNMRGLATHAVAITAATTELELTAWVDTAAAGPETPELSLRINGSTAPNAKPLYGKDSAERPAAMRWTVPLSPARLEFKMEVVATKPGSQAETSAIFVNRQF